MPLLEERASCVDNEELLTPSMFAHLQNDIRLSGSYLQGNTFAKTTQFLEKMLSFIVEGKSGILPEKKAAIEGVLKKFKEEVHGLTEHEEAVRKIIDECNKDPYEIEKNIKFAEQEIDKLSNSLTKRIFSGEKVKFTGGWEGNEKRSGHAMAYEFFQKDDGNIVFLIYNTGSGIENHAREYGKKHKYYPVMAYEIPKSDYIQSHISGFITRLIRPEFYPTLKTTTYFFEDEYNKNKEAVLREVETDGKRLYEEIFPKLLQYGGKKIDPTPYCKTPRIEQQSGTCSMRVLMPMIRNSMDAHSYQELLYEMKLQSILDFYRLQKKLGKLGDTNVQWQLRPAVEKLSRSTRRWAANNKRRTGFILSDQRATEVLNLCDTVLKDLGEQDLSILQKPPPTDQSSLMEEINKIKDKEENGTFKVFTIAYKPAFEPAKVEKIAQDFAAPRDHKEINFKFENEPLHYLKRNKEILDLLAAEGPPEKFTLAFESMILKLPVSGKNADEYWSRLDPKESMEAFEMMRGSLLQYAQQIKKISDLPFPQRTIIVNAALLIITRLAKQIQRPSPDALELQPPDTDLLIHFAGNKFESESKSAFFMSFDPLMDAKIQEIQYKKINTSYTDDDLKFRKDYDTQLLKQFPDLKDILTNMGKGAEKDLFDEPARYSLYKIIQGSFQKPDHPDMDKLLEQFDLSLKISELNNLVWHINEGRLAKLNLEEINTTKERRFAKVKAVKSYGDIELHTGLEHYYGYDGRSLKDAEPYIASDSINSRLEGEIYGKDNSNQVSVRQKRYLSEIQSEIQKEKTDKKFAAKTDLMLGSEISAPQIPYSRVSFPLEVAVTLDFFNQNIEILENPDYQSHLLFNLFKPGLLQASLELAPHMAEKWLEFLEKGMRYHSKKGRLEGTSLFFVRLSFMLENYLYNMGMKEVAKQFSKFEYLLIKELSQVEDEIAKLPKENIESKRTKSGQLKDLYECYLLRTKMRSKTESPFDSKTAATILKANFFIHNAESLPKSLRPADPNINREIRECMEMARFQMIESLSNLNDRDFKKLIMEKFKGTACPFKEDAEITWSGKFPIFRIQVKDPPGSFTLDCIRAEWRSDTAAQGLISDLFYTQAFTAYFGTLPRTAMLYPSKDQHIAEFSTEKGEFRVIVDNNRTTHIQKKSKRDNHWYQKIDKSYFKSEHDEISKIPLILLEKGNDVWVGEPGSSFKFLLTNEKGEEIVELIDISYLERQRLEKQLQEREDKLKQLQKELEYLKSPEYSQEKLLKELQEDTMLPSLKEELKKIDDKEVDANDEKSKRRSKIRKEHLEDSIKQVEGFVKEMAKNHVDTDIAMKQIDVDSTTEMLNSTKERLANWNKDEAQHPNLQINRLESGRKTGYSLINLKNIKGLNSLLSGFEDPTFILAWRKDAATKGEQESYLIELPRYGITLLGQKNALGQWQFIWEQDKNYQLVLEKPKSSIPNFRGMLVLQKIGAKENEANLDRRVLLPKQQFVMPAQAIWNRNNFPLPKKLEDGGDGVETGYYPVDYDVSNTHMSFMVENFREMNDVSSLCTLRTTKKMPNADFNQFSYSNHSAYLQILLDEKGEFKPTNNEQRLYLAYLHLGQQQPEKALSYLKAYRQSGGLKGNKDDIELLRRIMCDIPATLNRQDLITTEDRFKSSSPEIAAVRAYCANLLLEFQQLTTLPPDFGAMPMPGSQEEHHILYPKIIAARTRHFYNNELTNTIDAVMSGYNALRDHIPDEMKLSTNQEFRLLTHLKQKRGSLLGDNSFRYSELLEQNIRKEIRQLDFKAKYSETGLSPRERQRYKYLQANLAKSKSWNAVKTEFGTFSVNILPEEHPLFKLASIPDLVLRGNNAIIRALDVEKNSKWVAELIFLGTDVVPEHFLASFTGLYKLAKEAKSDRNEDEKKMLDKYLKYMLSIALDKKLGALNFAPSLIGSLCQILLYVQQFPDQFPTLPEKGIFQHKISPRIYEIFQIANKCAEKSPLKMNYEGQITRKIKTFRKAKPTKLTRPASSTLSTQQENPLQISVIKAKETKVKEMRTHLPTEVIPTIVTQIKRASKADIEQPLWQALGLEDFHQALEKSQEMASKEPPRLKQPAQSLSDVLVDDKKTATEKAKDEKVPTETYIINEVARFQQEIQTGQVQNLSIATRKNISRQTLTDEKKLHAIHHWITAEEDKLKKFMQAKKKELLSLANQAKLSPGLSMRAGLLGKKQRLLDFNKLLWLFLQNDMDLYRKITKLPDTEIHLLHQKMQEFLIGGTRDHHYQRIIDQFKILQDKKADHEIHNQVLERLGEELNKQRQYDPALAPEMLVFEFCERDIMIKPEQARFIQELTSKYGKDYKNKIIQLVMGGGKSKVLLPLLALKKANGNNLSIIEVPHALFKTNCADLEATSMLAFGQKAYPFEFNRSSNTSPLTLAKIYQGLRDVMQSRNFVITTPETIQSLELKYYEMLNMSVKSNTPEEKSWAKSLGLLDKILKLIKRRGDVVMDEVDSLLNVKKELNYAMGTPSILPITQRETIVSLYGLLSKVRISDEKPTLESIMKEKAYILDEKDWPLYFKKLAEQLVYDPNSPMSSFINKLDATEKQQLILYLNDRLGSQERERIKLVEKAADAKEIKEDESSFLEKIKAKLPNKNERDILFTLKGILSYLPNTLQRKRNVNYGLTKDPNKSKQKNIAIPYLGNNAPNEKSQFGNPLETALFTMQIQANNPIPADIVKRMIVEFKHRADLQKYEQYLLTHEIKTIDDTPAGKEFFELTGCLLSDIELQTEVQIQHWQTLFTGIEKVRSYCLTQYILAEIEYSPMMLRSNAQNHLRLLHTRQGVTGTPSNAVEFQTTMSYHPEDTQGTDGQTLDHLITKGTNGHIEADQDPAKLLRHILSTHATPERISALLDAGALFKGIPNLEIAQKIAQFFQSNQGKPDDPLNDKLKSIKYILFYDNENILCAYSLQNNNVISIGSTNNAVIQSKLNNCGESGYFTYFDQLRCRGTDIKQQSQGVGLLTIGEDLNEVELRQAAMRMRGLPEQQGIEFIVPKHFADAHPEIKANEWNAKNIIKIAKAVDLKKDPIDHYRAGLQDISAYVRDILNTFIKNSKQPNPIQNIRRKQKLFQIFSPCIVTKVEEDVEVLYSGVEREVRVPEALARTAENNYQQLINLLNTAKIPLSEEQRKKYHSELLAIAERTAKNCLSTEKQASKASLEMGTEVEQQQEQQEEKQKEQQKEQQKETMSQVETDNPQSRIRTMTNWPDNLKPSEFNLLKEPWPDDLPKIMKLNQMINQSSRKAEFKFDENIFASENYAVTLNGQADLLDQYKKPVHVYLILEDPKTKGLQAMVVTQEEGSFFLAKLRQEFPNPHDASRKFWLMTPQETVIYGSSNKPNHQDYPRIRDQICFFNGDSDVLQRNLNNQSWMMENSVGKMQYLDTTLLPNMPSKRKFFKGLQEKLNNAVPTKAVLFSAEKEIKIHEVLKKPEKPKEPESQQRPQNNTDLK